MPESVGRRSGGLADVVVVDLGDEEFQNGYYPYNSILLSGILSRYQAGGKQKALELLKRISPVAWQHIHFLGHYIPRQAAPDWKPCWLR